MQPDLIPRQGKQPVHALERAPRRLRHTDPDPHPTDDGDGGEIPERPVGVDPARRNREEHVRHRARVAVLVGEMQRHSHEGRQGADTQGEQFRDEQVLHGIPAEGPAEA